MSEFVERKAPEFARRVPVSRGRWLLLALVIGVGVALTLLAVWASIDDAHQRALSAFDREVGSRVLDAEKRISGSLEAIDEVGGLFAASTSSVTREEFLTFASSTLARHSDLRSLAWAPLVTDVERGAFEAEARASGIVGYSIMEYAQGAEAHPAGKRDSYLPLLYAVNVAGEAPDYGLDITTWSRLRGMIDQARDAGSPRVTATFETPSGLKVTVFHPHYRKGAPTGTVDERRAAFSGIVFGIMDPSLVLGHEEPGPLDSQLEDGIMTSAAEVTAIGAGSILFRDSEFDEANERFSVSYTLPVGNQKWVLTFVSTDVLDAWVDTNQPWVLLVLGLAIAGLIGGYLIILQRQSTTAEAMLATRARQLAVANAALYREVSERAVAEALAVAERGQLQSILNTTVDAIITIDGRGVIQSFNSAAQSTFGYAPNEVIGQNVSMLMPEPDHSAHDQYLSNYQNAGEARIIGTGREVTGLRKDGRRFPLELSVSEVPVSEGKLYTGIVRDRSVRKAAEAALAFSEARFRLLFESSPVGITFSSGTDGIEQVSPAMLRMLERSEGEVLGRILADFDDESYSQARTDSRVQIMPGQTDSTVSERLLKRASGAPLWVQIQAGAFRNEKNEVVGVVRTVEDITQRKAAESEARLRAMLESAPIGMAWSTPGESLQTVNPKFREILGRTAEEIAGHKLSDFSAPGGTQRRTSTSDILSDGLQDAVTQELQLVRGDGGTIWVAVTASAVRQPDGRINGVLRMVEDITERRQAEKDLRASEERFRVLIESAPVGIMVSHEHDSATLANPALAAMLGVPSDLVLGKRLTDYWYPRYEQQRSGSRAVRRLRQKLRATESNEIIRTHRGLGYSFIQAD